MRRYLTAIFALFLTMSGPVFGFDLKNMSPEEQAAFRAEIRAYLLENPEVIMEAVAVLEKRDAAAQAREDEAMIQSNAKALFEDKQSWVGGNPDGDVVMVEFLDYRCAYCRKAHDEVEKLLKRDGNIKLIVKDYPILGEASTVSARYAQAVRMIAGDEAYKAAGDALIKLKGNPNAPTLKRLSESLGIDAAEVHAKMYGPEVDAVIAANHALGQKMKINGTPTFVIGNQMLRGYLPLPGMLEKIAQARSE